MTDIKYRTLCWSSTQFIFMSYEEQTRWQKRHCITVSSSYESIGIGYEYVITYTLNSGRSYRA